MRLESPPPDHVIPSSEPATKPCGAKHILNEVIRKHFQGFTACPLTSPHRFSPLTILGKYARVWHRPYLNRANNLSYVIGSLSDYIIHAEGPLVVNKSLPTKLFIRFHDEWTDLKFVEDVPVIDHYDYKKSKVYHAALDFGDVVIKSINMDHLREMLKTARFSTDQLVPGHVYHMIYSVVLSSRLRFLGDLQKAYLSEVPDDVFVTQYTQFHSLKDSVCRGIGVIQTMCPVAFKTCDVVVDSKGCLTLLQNWNDTQSLTDSLEPAHIVFTDSVICSSFIKDCLLGLFTVLQISLTDSSAVPRALRLLRLVSGLNGRVTFPRAKFICRKYEIELLETAGYMIKSCNDLNDIAVECNDGDSMEKARLFARSLHWASGLPKPVFHNLVSELHHKVPVKTKAVKKKKVCVSSSLQMSEV